MIVENSSTVMNTNLKFNFLTWCGHGAVLPPCQDECRFSVQRNAQDTGFDVLFLVERNLRYIPGQRMYTLIARYICTWVYRSIDTVIQTDR